MLLIYAGQHRIPLQQSNIANTTPAPNVQKLFRRQNDEQDVAEVLVAGSHRVAVHFYHKTDLAQSKIGSKMATALVVSAEIIKKVLEKRPNDPMRKFAEEMGLAFATRSGRRNKQDDIKDIEDQIEEKANLTEEDQVEIVVFEGVVHAVTDSKIPADKVEQIIRTVMGVLKNQAIFYETGNFNLSAPSSNEETG